MRPMPFVLAVYVLVHLNPQPVPAQVARVKLQSTSNGEVAADPPPLLLRLQDAQIHLFDGRYDDAAAEYSTVVNTDDASGRDTLTAWAYHGMAVAAALAGDRARARAIYDELLRVAPESPLAIADSIEAAVLTGRRDFANRLLDRFAKTRPGALPQQYTRSFRALSLLLVGRCTDAVAEVGRAPDPDRPLPQAIRGRCAAVAGHHAEAIALRDSVMTQPLADPYSWPMIIARGVARRIN
jgi:tetratricopeptide (TPR) repeat protein